MIATTPRTAARQITVARAQRAQRPVSTSETGVSRAQRTERERRAAAAGCRWVRDYGSHCLAVVEADLPGDRSVGYCDCGHYVDTGTWDERNGLA